LRYPTPCRRRVPGDAAWRNPQWQASTGRDVVDEWVRRGRLAECLRALRGGPSWWPRRDRCHHRRVRRPDRVRRPGCLPQHDGLTGNDDVHTHEHVDQELQRSAAMLREGQPEGGHVLPEEERWL